jgi:hypothetical protein
MLRRTTVKVFFEDVKFFGQRLCGELAENPEKPGNPERFGSSYDGRGRL